MIKKILVSLVLIVIVLVAGGYSYLNFTFPRIGDIPEVTIEPTPEMLARGQYLFHVGAACVDCHSTRDDSKFAHPLVEGTWGKGGQAFDQKKGFPGAYYAPNITPAGVGEWTDTELYTAIVCGISRDGRALFPIMPYPNYSKMDKEDIKAIIAYMRTLEPIENEVPASSSDFPMTLIIKTIPGPPAHADMPDKSDKAAYGKYVATMASCGDCHTPIDDKGQPLPGLNFAGGMPFVQATGGTCYSANITPHEKSGIGSWTEDVFVQRFKAYADSNYVPPKVQEGSFNSEMPWEQYAQMKEEDLRAIYAYLQTLEPVDHQVGKFEP